MGAALVEITPKDEDDLDALLLAHNSRFVQLLAEARQRVRVTGGMTMADLRRRLEQAPEQPDAPQA